MAFETRFQGLSARLLRLGLGAFRSAFRLAFEARFRGFSLELRDSVAMLFHLVFGAFRSAFRLPEAFFWKM